MIGCPSSLTTGVPSGVHSMPRSSMNPPVIGLQGAAQNGFDYIFSPLASSCWTTAESAPVASSLCKCLMTSSLSEVTEPSEKYEVKVIVDDTFSGLNNMMKMLDCWYCS